MADAEEGAVKVYIAAPYQARQQAIELAELLKGARIECCARWVTEGFEEVNAENARNDLEDIEESDCLVAFNPPEWKNSGTGGRHVEFGYALAIGKPIVLVGERSNIFHQLPLVRVVPNVADAAVAIWESQC